VTLPPEKVGRGRAGGCHARLHVLPTGCYVT
jgi:hypothetical protein